MYEDLCDEHCCDAGGSRERSARIRPERCAQIRATDHEGLGRILWDFMGVWENKNTRKKRSEFCLGSVFFGISDLGFLPYGVPIKGVIEKGLIFDEK